MVYYGKGNYMLVVRNGEIKILDKMLASNSSELIAIFGRRRVGKTFLVI
jgi:hypothetical protein